MSNPSSSSHVYHSSHFHSRIEIQQVTAQTFHTLAHILRMATRYGIDRAAAEVVSCIRAEWPDGLIAHMTKHGRNGDGTSSQPLAEPQPVQSTITSNARASDTASSPHRRVDSGTTVHPATVIALLRECGYSDATLLFPLFYALSCTVSRTGIASLGAPLAILSGEDTARLIVGIELLRAGHASRASYPQRPRLAEADAHWCTPGVAALWTAVVTPRLLNSIPVQPANHNVMADPVRGWWELARALQPPGALASYSICPRCCEKLKDGLKVMVVKLWENLPNVFGLAGSGLR